jgi:hypothetical protein
MINQGGKGAGSLQIYLYRLLFGSTFTNFKKGKYYVLNK